MEDSDAIRRAVIGRAACYLLSPHARIPPEHDTTVGARSIYCDRLQAKDAWEWLILAAYDEGLPYPALYIAQTYADFFSTHWDPDPSINARRFDPRGRTLPHIDRTEGTSEVVALLDRYLAIR